MDMEDMENLWHRQTHLGDEPIYCAAYDASEPVLCAGSDEELDKTARVAKRLRYEEHGLRYLRGQRPSILSASLRGPFDSTSGWKNPWTAPKQTKMKFAVTKPLAKSAAKPPPVLQKRLEKIVTPEAGTPATRDSMQCHLPSPDSHRELDLTDNTHLDTEKRTRIQEWASKVPADTLERDQFWAPSDAAADMSDASSVTKRPAGSEWLKSKLKKRRRTDPSSSGMHSTPTPAHGRAPAQTPCRSNNASQLHSSHSFEQTTPSSSNAHQDSNSPRKHVGNQTKRGAAASEAPLSKSNAAFKPIALKRLSSTTTAVSATVPTMSSLCGDQGAPPSGRSSRLSRTSTQEANCDNCVQDPTPQMVPPAEGTRDCDPQMDENGADASFKSQLDHSFHYKTRPTKRASITMGEAIESTNGNISQLTQTGTPESEDRGGFAPVQTKQPQKVTRLSPDELDQEHSRVTGVASDRGPNPPEDSTGGGQAALTQINDTADDHMYGEFEQNDGDQLSGSESQHIISEHAYVLEVTGNQTSVEEHGKIMLHDDLVSLEKGIDTTARDEMAAPETTPTQPTTLQREDSTEAETKTLQVEETTDCTLPLVTLDQEPTLVGDITDIDGSTLIRMPEVPRRLEAVKNPDQPPQAPEVVRDLSQAATSTELCRSKLPLQNLLADIAETAYSSLNQTITAATENTANVKDREEVTENNASADHASDSGNSVIIIPLSQLEWGVVGHMKESPRRVRKQVEESSGECSIKVEPVDEDGEGAENQPPTNAPQSPWALDHMPFANQIKAKPADRAWTSCSQPVSVMVSPSRYTRQQADLPPSQQSPWAPVADQLKANSKGISIDVPVPEALKHAALEGQRTPWDNTSEQNMITSIHSGQLATSDAPILEESFSTRADSTDFSTRNVGDKSSHSVASSSVDKICPVASALFQLTPLRDRDRDATPEMDLSIKSFAKFNTPSPRRKMGTPRYPGLSGDRLRSTQPLADTTGTNPWSSARSSFRSSGRPRSNLRVSFASLPDEDDKTAAAGERLAFAARAASPPPQSSGEMGDEDASVGFHAHFDILRRRSGFTPKFRLQPRLLPNESQQKPMSPEVGAMAEAFREAEVRMSTRSSPEIAVDEAENIPDNGNDNDASNGGRHDGARAQSPWRVESQGADDVAAVLQNLDDFLNPRWDVDAEVEKARSGDGIENQGLNRSSEANILGSSIWDMP